jgi:hypothetical protein
VERTGASRSTIRRYREAGKFPNAYKDTSKAWRFPLEDLLAAGLSVSEPAAERALNTPTEQPNTATAEQVSKLEQALREERTRADNAERLAASYLDNVHDLRRALLMLEAGASKPEQSTEQALNKVTEQPMTSPIPVGNSVVSEPEQPTLNTAKDGSKPVPVWRRLLSRR